MAKRPAPTKANLFKAQHELRFATEGHELLNQKRDVLVMELMSVAAAFMDAEAKLRDSMDGAFESFIPAYLAAGQETMKRVFASARSEVELEVAERAVMGTSVPEVRIGLGGEPLFTGLLDATPEMDAAVTEMGSVMGCLVEYIETVATIWRLATEVEKTQRRINAIENVFIPESRDAVTWIKSVMEENEREELFRRQLLKRRA
ncbi:MAG: V-type ATP synthase subunit D [Verrucomicrobia bacterium]|nr:V-type ATP synthase subunit D [Verrucomicrobiota bacterium]MBT7064966.1 V-type ATP synthase subunit D [Verrucomicrobiota bacterium]MBT7701417.1 V-type ATP synthase subunit D [Verrucomicrobiota bacterium]